MSQTCQKVRFSIFISEKPPDFLGDFQHALVTSRDGSPGSNLHWLCSMTNCGKSRWMTGIQTLLRVAPDGCFEQLYKINGACICMRMHGSLRVGQFFRKIGCLK